MSKKLLAIVLALVTCLTMLPVTAAAGVRLPLAEQFGAAETRVSLTTGAKLTAEPEACDHDTWTPWTTQTDLPTESGSYYLDTDVKLEETWEKKGIVKVDGITLDAWHHLGVKEFVEKLSL